MLSLIIQPKCVSQQSLFSILPLAILSSTYHPMLCPEIRSFAPLIYRLSLFLSIPAPLCYLYLTFFYLSYRRLYSFPPSLSVYFLSQRRAWFTSWSTISESKKSRAKSKPQSAGLQLVQSRQRWWRRYRVKALCQWATEEDRFAISLSFSAI